MKSCRQMADAMAACSKRHGMDVELGTTAWRRLPIIEYPSSAHPREMSLIGQAWRKYKAQKIRTFSAAARTAFGARATPPDSASVPTGGASRADDDASAACSCLVAAVFRGDDADSPPDTAAACCGDGGDGGEP
mmetsp:Transcript_21604/g.69009  ORF Transcript_21604/g.69009 Transcript_21604/m.69009 type:complete len:134 (+) Transcript_21604:742-1143(+)